MTVSPLISTFLTLGADVPQDTFRSWGQQVEADVNAATAALAAVNETIDDRVAALLVAGAGITKTYNDALNTLELSAPGAVLGAGFNGAALGLLTNPFFEVSQQNLATKVTGISAGVYGADQWVSIETGATSVGSVQNIADPFSSVATLKRLKNSIKVIAETPQASFTGAETFLPIYQLVEGNFFKSLGWGGGDARAIDVVFILQASVAGTYALSIRNAAQNRSYVKTFALAANTPTIFFATIPGETSGTWPTDGAASASIAICAVAGSTLQAPSLDTWLSNNYNSHSTATNWAATSSAFVQVAYCQMFPSGVLPFTSAAQITGEALQLLLNMRRPWDEELRRCARYWTKSYDYAVAPGTPGLDGGFDFYVPTGGTGTFRTPVRFPVRMRAIPTVTAYDVLGASGVVFKGANGKTATISEVGESGCTIGTADATSASELFFHYIASARM